MQENITEFMSAHEEKLEGYPEQIEEFISSKQYSVLRDLFLPLEPADIAYLLEECGEAH